MIWIVWARCGMYSDTSVWIVASFLSEGLAEDFAATCRAWIVETLRVTNDGDDEVTPEHLATCPDEVLRTEIESGWFSFSGYERETVYAVCKDGRQRLR